MIRHITKAQSIFSHARRLLVLAASMAPLGLSAQTTNCVPPVSGLVSWWPGAGDARDFVGGADGTYTGAYPTGMVGQAFSLTSFGPMLISDKESLNPTNQITLEAWVRVSGGGSSFNIISK